MRVIGWTVDRDKKTEDVKKVDATKVASTSSDKPVVKKSTKK